VTDSTRITDLPMYRPSQATQVPPCQASCAAHGDVRGWIGIVAQRSRTGLAAEDAYRLAWERLAEGSPFPASMGRVCPHPCESGCNRVAKDSPISINSLERFLGDWAIEHDLTPPLLSNERTGRSIAVIGAGPAGLSGAYQLARRGHDVVVYDRHALPGGMLRYGIPDYRLPPRTLDAEIDRIASLGVSIECGVDIGSDVTLEGLRGRHDAVFIAAGAQLAVTLDIPGEHLSGVITGVDYLEEANTGATPDLGGRVVVVGGGNTAVDAARVARRAGAEVELHYRRTRTEMPAIATEVEEALAEGIVLRELVAPVEIHGDPAGRVEAVRMQAMRLGPPDDGGRRRPVPVADSYHDIPATGVVVAVSQRPALERLLGAAPPRADRPVEIEPGLWIGGDALDPSIAAAAIRHGRLVAETVHADLTGTPRPEFDLPDPIQATAIDFGLLPDAHRADGDHVSVDDALSDPAIEVALGIDEGAFLDEVDRCFSCGLCHGCGRCQMYCTVGVFTAVENPRPGSYYSMDLTACTSCGKCIEVCPCGYLTSTESLVDAALGVI
jgi:formate dehydrogenase major subunit